MKKIILLSLLSGMLVCKSAIGQLTEYETSNKNWVLYGQVKYVGPTKASLQYIVDDSDSTFLLLMKDARPELKSYFSVKFNSRGNTLQNFYNILVSIFEKENWNNKDYIRALNWVMKKYRCVKHLFWEQKQLC